MPNSHLLGSFIRRFLLESVIADRNLSRNTQTSQTPPAKRVA